MPGRRIPTEKEDVICWARAVCKTHKEAATYCEAHGYPMSPDAFRMAYKRIRSRAQAEMRNEALNFEASHIEKLKTLRLLLKLAVKKAETADYEKNKLEAMARAESLIFSISEFESKTQAVMEATARQEKLLNANTEGICIPAK